MAQPVDENSGQRSRAGVPDKDPPSAATASDTRASGESAGASRGASGRRFRWKAPGETLDRATVGGLAGMLALLIGGMVVGAGSSADVFWRASSAMLVIGGAVLATLVTCPPEAVRMFGGVLRNALFVRHRPVDEVIATLVALATIARREGLLALDPRVDRIDDPFLQEGMRMAIDGADPASIESVMKASMESTDLRHTYGRNMLEVMGRSAPVFGMIGTVIGLVIMLGRMDDPATIGPGMAVALLTTLYGLVFANVFCLPLARKLGYRSSEELLRKTIVLQGILAVQAGDHPRIVEQKLRAFCGGNAARGAWDLEARLARSARQRRETVIEEIEPSPSKPADRDLGEAA